MEDLCTFSALRRSRIALRMLSSLLLVFAVAAPSFGQQFATLNLTVADPAGSVIRQAKVSVRSVDIGVTQP